MGRQVTVEMVGRRSELDEVVAAFDSGRAGTPRFVLVGGEAGIGKSRLVEELLAHVARATTTLPTVVAVGQCVETGAIGAPFAPIRRLLRDVYREVGDVAFRRAAGSPALLARLGAVLPELDSGSDASPESRHPCDAGEDAIAEAVQSVLETLSETHHLVLVVEDLHWADSATLALLRTLTATLKSGCLTAVLTYRTEDVGTADHLLPVLTDLERHRGVSRLTIGRLCEADAVSLVRRLEPSIGPEDCEDIVVRGQGIPFFIEELADLRDGRLPDSLRSVVLARYLRLGGSARAIVDLLSVGGLEVEHRALAAVHDGDVDERDRALREAVDARVITVAGSRYAFRHAILRESVEERLLPGDRIAHHRAYAVEADQRLAGGDRAAALTAADHFLSAGETAAAFTASVLARRHALEVLAPVTAAELGARLVELWMDVPTAMEQVGTSRRELAAEVVEQWSDLGHHERALTIGRRLIEGAADAEDPLGSGLLHQALVRPLIMLGRRAEAAQEARIAASLLTDSKHPKAAAARATAFAAAELHRVTSGLASPDDVRMDMAVALAEASGDPVSLATCRLMAAWVAQYRGEDELALSVVRAATSEPGIGTVRRLNGRLAEVESLIRLGRLEDAVALGRAARQEAVDVGRARVQGSHLALKVARALLLAGRPTEALPLIHDACERLPSSPVAAAITGRLLVGHHSWNAERDLADASRPPAPLVAAIVAEDPEERAGWAAVDAEAALIDAHTADPRRRRGLVTQALTTVAALGEAPVAYWPGLSRALVPAAAWALAEARLLGLEDSLCESVSESLDQAVTGMRQLPFAAALAALVVAESARGQEHPDPGAWELAAKSVVAGTLPVTWVDYAHYRQAEALLSLGRRADAARVLDQVRVDATAHGATALTAWVEELGVRPSGSSMRATTGSGLASLTDRELQVLALVAEGLTNPQIGRRLHMAPKTASIHVSAILAKLNLATRTEAGVAYATSRTTDPGESGGVAP